MNGPLTALAAKEFRALLPVWAAAAFTLGADPLLRGTGMHSLFPVGLFAYIVGSLALGAHVIGHEFTNRTLASLLVQPCRRSSILLTKTSVLAAMLVALGFIARVVVFQSVGRTFGNFPRYPTLYLPLIGGFCVAPYLTMRLRSQMAGVVFTASIPGMTYLIALLGGGLIYGTGTAAAGALARNVCMAAMGILAAGGAVLSARSFMRLQDTEGAREDVRLPRWFTLTDASPIRPPLWMLAKKELRLQQMTFAMVAFYALIWTSLTIAGRLNPEFGREFPIQGVGLLYFALLPLLMGSLASAQERQFGMLQSQAMLPVPRAQQWAVKAGVVLVLSLVLGVILPWFVFAPPQLSRESFWPLLASIALLTTWSLYISSWCRSGIIALALLLPASAAALLLARSIDWLMVALLSPRRAVAAYGALTQPSAVFTLVIAATPLAALLLWFAARNHWTSERQPKAIAVQVAGLAGCLLWIDVVATVFQPFSNRHQQSEITESTVLATELGLAGGRVHVDIGSSVPRSVRERGPANTVLFTLRTASDPAALVGHVRTRLKQLDSHVILEHVATMSQRMSDTVAQPRFQAAMLGAFAVVALALAAVGLYGVMSYAVSQRAREIAIRMALGAGRGNVIALVAAQGMALTTAGIAAGLAGAYVLTRNLESMLFGLSTFDASTVAGVSMLLAAVAALAIYLPARRATGVDPARALRYQQREERARRS